jgi:hypothetical protein
MNLTLTLTPGQLDRIAQVLAKQPWGEVNDLLVLFQQQITAQQQPQEYSHANGNPPARPNGLGQPAEH